MLKILANKALFSEKTTKTALDFHRLYAEVLALYMYRQ